MNSNATFEGLIFQNVLINGDNKNGFLEIGNTQSTIQQIINLKNILIKDLYQNPKNYSILINLNGANSMILHLTNLTIINCSLGNFVVRFLFFYKN